MNLIYIYGPPGVGKFTVSKELSRLTGYRLFHNQLSIEFVKSVFDFGDPSFNRLVLKFRAEMIEEAARRGISVIFTSAYAKGMNDEIIRDLVRRVERHGGRVRFVRLYCDRKTLLDRVRRRSRNGFFKIRSKKQLAGLLKRYNHLSAIPFAESLEIDNTKTSAGRAARMILSHYRLGRD